MAILNGTEVKLYATNNLGVGAGNLVAFAQNCSISIEHSPRDITNKQSGGFSESLEGLRSWSIEMDGAYAWTDASGSNMSNAADALLETNLLPNRAKFFVGFGGTTTVADDIRYTGECYITSFSVTAGTEDTSTYSISLAGTGTLSVLTA